MVIDMTNKITEPTHLGLCSHDSRVRFHILLTETSAEPPRMGTGKSGKKGGSVIWMFVFHLSGGLVILALLGRRALLGFFWGRGCHTTSRNRQRFESTPIQYYVTIPGSCVFLKNRVNIFAPIVPGCQQDWFLDIASRGLMTVENVPVSNSKSNRSTPGPAVFTCTFICIVLIFVFVF